MFLWRSLYLRIYGLLALAITGFAVFKLLQGDWGWLGPLLAWFHLPCINAWRQYKENYAYRDERERLAMTSTLLGVALVLIAGSRDWPLALTLAGLFGLLLYVFIASALPRGLREEEGEQEGLAGLPFTAHSGLVSLQELNADKPVLVQVLHSAAHCYSRMAARELEVLLRSGDLPLPPEQCVVVFPGQLPEWSESLNVLGVHCWQDSEGDSLEALGVWLRGGNWLFSGGSNAARPVLAVLPAGKSGAALWFEASNFRMPPSLQNNLTKISRVV